MSSRRHLSLASLALIAALTGCAGNSTSPSAAPASPGSPGASSPVPPASSPVPPTSSSPDISPTNNGSAPPKKPTDENSPGWITGTVTRGGSGPCYGMITDDGVEYALYDAAGTTLERNDRVRVRATEGRLKINCGAGKLVEVLELQPV
jgi:hypothetical protein